VTPSQPTGTTWTTREEPGWGIRADPEAMLPRRVPTAQLAPAVNAPTIAEDRVAPPTQIPAPAPVLRPAPAKPATVPTIRSGEPVAARPKPANGDEDPVSRWLIGGTAEAGAADVDPDATQTSAPAVPASAPGNREPSQTGDWQWSAELGQWVRGGEPTPIDPAVDADR
jgi:hypothetical protein